MKLFSATILFSYTALDSNNNYIRGTISGKSAKRVLKDLAKQDLIVINIRQENKPWFSKLQTITTIRTLDKILFTRHLHTLLESGIVLDQAIKITEDQTNNQRFKQMLHEIHGRVRKGESLSNSLSKYPSFFSPFYINLINVGERSGTLDDVLAHLLEQQERDYELVTKTRGAMIYPGIIIAAAITIVTLMLTFVIPNITAILTEYNVELPLATKILIFISNTLLQYGLIVVALGIVWAYLIKQWFKTPKGKNFWHSFKLKIPVLKEVIKEFNLARFSRAMNALLKSGMSIDESLELAGSICGNVRYQQTIKSSIGLVRKGVPLTEVLKGYPEIYPPITVQMLEVGEKTGKSDHMFNKLANFYEKSVLNTINNLSSIIEPVLLLMIGLGVAFIAVSVLTPIWKFAQTI